MSNICISTSYDSGFHGIGEYAALTMQLYGVLNNISIRVDPNASVSDRPTPWHRVKFMQQLFNEGYAVGLALLFKNATTLAYDTHAEAQRLCKSAAEINGVMNRMRVTGACDPNILQDTLSYGGKCLVVCDCEGYEETLIDLNLVPALKKSTILVECHDFLNREITTNIKTRLSKTHKVDLIDEGARNPNMHEFQAKLSSIDRWITVCEFRPEKMGWLWCVPN